MCNARNHPPGCNCGWGQGWQSGGYGLGGRPSFLSGIIGSSKDISSNYLPTPTSFVSVNAKTTSTNVLSGSWVEPNASCPVCGQRVYFLQPKSGGKVYFDELGPPWPKHICTDYAGYKEQNFSKEGRWDRMGWKPLLNFAVTVAGFDRGEGWLMRVYGEDEHQKKRYFLCRVKDDVEFDIFRFLSGEKNSLSILAHNRKGDFLVYEGQAVPGQIFQLNQKGLSCAADLGEEMKAALLQDAQANFLNEIKAIDLEIDGLLEKISLLNLKKFAMIKNSLDQGSVLD